MKTIGVFDSGIGGLSVARAIEKVLPEDKVIFVNDKDNVPYGEKSPEELLRLVEPIIEKLSQNCDVIVVACNTVSTNVIGELRAKIKVPLVAMEPMVKPAAEKTRNGAIAVCATPATLKSKRYEWLKDTFARGIKVIEPDCSDWTRMIETNNIDRQHIEERIENSLKEGADEIVLGCTHYHWIEDLIKEIVAGRAEVLQPEVPVIDQLQRILAELA